MNSKNIIIGEYYRLKNTPKYGWAKILAVLKPHSGINTHGYLIAKCEWAVDKDSVIGLIKYFRVSDLFKEKEG